MADYDLQLNCTKCGAFVEYLLEQKAADGSQIVRCDECGKRHSDENIYMVDRDRRYERDEAGNLLEEPL